MADAERGALDAPEHMGIRGDPGFFGHGRRIRFCLLYREGIGGKMKIIKRILAWLAERLYDPNPQDDETHAATRYAMMDKEATK